MAEKDIVEKILEDYPEVFADIVNVLLFDGDEIVRPDELKSASPVSMYKADGKLHQQERDIAKYWIRDNKCCALYGLENQSQSEKKMPLRVIGYDGASYRTELLSDDGTYPVITLVLHFGKEKWSENRSLHDICHTPTECRKYVGDYQINVFSIAWMSEEEISRFQSDFRVVADFFRQKRIGIDYIPINVKIRHIDEVLKMLAVFTQDERFMTLPKLTNEGKRPETMCEVYDMIEQMHIFISACFDLSGTWDI